MARLGNVRGKKKSSVTIDPHGEGLNADTRAIPSVKATTDGTTCKCRAASENPPSLATARKVFRLVMVSIDLFQIEISKNYKYIHYSPA